MKKNLKGLYVITDSKLIPRGNFIETVEFALKGGANIVQLREKDGFHDEVVELGKRLLEVTKKYNVPLIINDSPELAKAIGADGVHLGENDSDITFARKVIGEDSIIGVSCYGDIERGLEAEKDGADYLAFGTPYSTPTKPGRKPTSFETLIEAKKLITTIPIFAIGGIYPENAKDVLATGVDGIAAITSVFGSDDVEESARKLAVFF
ncbi:MAG: thiamine phosphate synthase [Thermodesulfobacteriota bacterium]